MFSLGRAQHNGDSTLKLKTSTVCKGKTLPFELLRRYNIDDLNSLVFCRDTVEVLHE